MPQTNARPLSARNLASVLLATCCTSPLHAQLYTEAPLALSPEADSALRANIEARGLSVSHDAQGYLRIGDRDLWWHVGRVATAPTASTLQTGLHRIVRSQPAGQYDYVLAFDDAQGQRMQQALVPASADWDGMQAALHDVPGVTEVAHDNHGDLRVVIDGRTLYGRLDPLSATTLTMWVNPDTHLLWAGDLNGDGTGDYHVIYPRQSLLQRLYVYPPRP
jgi:hypothetical protein